MKADRAGVIYSFSDGYQPGVQMNLYRFVAGLGVTPRLCGNIKGLHDPYRNPTTQRGFAEKWGQKSAMVASKSEEHTSELQSLMRISYAVFCLKKKMKKKKHGK